MPGKCREKIWVELNPCLSGIFQPPCNALTQTHTLITARDTCLYCLEHVRDLIFSVTGGQTYVPHHSGFWRRARHKARRTALPCWPGGHVWLVCPCKTGQAWRSPPPGGTYNCHCGHEAACGCQRGKLNRNLMCVYPIQLPDGDINTEQRRSLSESVVIYCHIIKQNTDIFTVW